MADPGQVKVWEVLEEKGHEWPECRTVSGAFCSREIAVDQQKRDAPPCQLDPQGEAGRASTHDQDIVVQFCLRHPKFLLWRTLDRQHVIRRR